ncbi:MAG: 5-formyltetrahydrofolate cyclo-ligase [Omnitrophica WOR_2 bacterium RIFCSPLOWO2_12_FULL_51_8]|nr:MAG: 5-formyltetrahydrofolate cyclo-ligase [Omnitrophica WOR_2 bacterium RIFCSPLOWO2_12_FULL_51_8]
MTKEEIRSKILLRLKTYKEEDRERQSKAIKAKLFRENFFQNAKTVMFYIAFRGEVNTEGMIKAARRLGKTVTVPVCIKNRATLKPCILDDNPALKNGPYGVFQPAAEKFVRLKDLDAVIVPGLAFDKEGRRLGRGKGYYDRFLKRVPKGVATIGLAFRFQIIPFVPTLTHDVSVKKVITA